MADRRDYRHTVSPGPLQERAMFHVKRLTTSAILPSRGSPGAVGYDLSADFDGVDGKVYIYSGARALIRTGIAVAIPPGHYGRVAPRSGLAVKKGIQVMAGVIDPDYRGQIFVLLFNAGVETAIIEHGDRIAQLILEKVSVLPVQEVHDLDPTLRGEGGFGSTGPGAFGKHGI